MGGCSTIFDDTENVDKKKIKYSKQNATSSNTYESFKRHRTSLYTTPQKTKNDKAKGREERYEISRTEEAEKREREFHFALIFTSLNLCGPEVWPTTSSWK